MKKCNYFLSKFSVSERFTIFYLITSRRHECIHELSPFGPANGEKNVICQSATGRNQKDTALNVTSIRLKFLILISDQSNKTINQNNLEYICVCVHANNDRMHTSICRWQKKKWMFPEWKSKNEILLEFVKVGGGAWKRERRRKKRNTRKHA